MTNGKKAVELVKQFQSCMNNGVSMDAAVMACLIEMAEWKEKQMIEKACEWLKNNTISVTNDTCTYTASSYDITKEEFIEGFGKAMKGGGDGR